MRSLFAILIFVFAGNSLNGQLTLEAQIRNRFEIRNGYQKLAIKGSAPTILISQRSRISVLYESEKLRLRISPQDVRLWGGDLKVNSSGVASNTGIGLFEGFAEIRIGSIGWLSAGRQQLSYDNEWIFSARNWNQNGLVYDAAVLKLNRNDWKLHAGISWNTLSESLSENHYPPDRIKSLNFIWFNNRLNENASFSMLHAASGVTRTDSTNALHFRQTSGLYYVYGSEMVGFSSNFFYQYGRNNTGAVVSAFLVFADFSLKTGPVTPGTGFSYLSGNNKAGALQDRDKLFDMLYGARHKYFGFLDYFSSLSSSTGQGGLVDYFAYLDIRVSDKLSFRNTGHYFRLAETNTLTPAVKGLGYENDLVMKFSFNGWGSIESGYLFFIPTQSMRSLQGITDNRFSQFYYLQMTITPTLFRQ